MKWRGWILVALLPILLSPARAADVRGADPWTSPPAATPPRYYYYEPPAAALPPVPPNSVCTIIPGPDNKPAIRVAPAETANIVASPATGTQVRLIGAEKVGWTDITLWNNGQEAHGWIAVRYLDCRQH